MKVARLAFALFLVSLMAGSGLASLPVTVKMADGGLAAADRVVLPAPGARFRLTSD